MNANKRTLVRRLFFLLLFPVLGWISTFTHAVMVKVSLRELTQKAQVIVLGEVVDIRCEWSRDGGMIMTVATLNVGEVLKGEAGRSLIRIQTPGGEIGGLGLRVSDMPEYARGEQVLVFLNPIINPRDVRHSPSVAQNVLPSFETFALAQGKFSIDSRGYAKREGFRLLDEKGVEEKPVFAADLKSRINGYLQETRKRRDKTHEKRKR